MIGVCAIAVVCSFCEECLLLSGRLPVKVVMAQHSFLLRGGLAGAPGHVRYQGEGLAVHSGYKRLEIPSLFGLKRL